jgi:hypothetical protein
MVKKVIQQGRNHFDARSVRSVREHDKMVRTPLVAFFNIPSHTTDSVALKNNTQATPHGLTFFHLWLSYVLLPNTAH